MDYHVSRGRRGFRAFGMFADPGGISAIVGGDFIPANHPNYDESLAWLCDELAAREAWLLNCSLVNCNWGALQSLDQRAHLQREAAIIVHRPNVIGQLTNEAGFNGVNVFDFNNPGGLVWTRGSRGTDYQPWHPEWDAFDFETNRDDDFERKYKDYLDQRTGSNPDGGVFGSEHKFAGPGGVSEMIGIGDVDQSGKTTANPFKIWQFVAGLKIVGCSFVILHGRSGIAGNLPVVNGSEDQCLDAGVEAGNLPLGRCADGEYQRGNSPGESQNSRLPVLHFDRDGDGGRPMSGTLRTHAMIVGNDAEVIAPGPGPEYTAVAANGWGIRETFKFQGQPGNVLLAQK